ncbi:hypothetical protein [Thioalkalivibrio sp. HK1]|nr:hypothetical protein [Thioalkalivibrio sp. HK1]
MKWTRRRLSLNQDNGCAERLIRTLKENPPWLETYSCIEELRQAF